jgi:hypothetical protein
VQSTGVGYFGRPYDFEPLEGGFNLVMHPKSFDGGAAPEEPPMSS